MATIPLQSDHFFDPTLTLSDLASSLLPDVITSTYYTSQIQQLVMRGIIECFLQIKEELVEADDDDDDDDGDEDDDDEGNDDEEDDYDEVSPHVIIILTFSRMTTMTRKNIKKMMRMTINPC